MALVLARQSVFDNLDLMREVFLYDTTYRDKFKDCIEELRWYDLIFNKINYAESLSYPLSVSIRQFKPTHDLMHSIMTKNMKEVIPHLKGIGCNADTFNCENCYWHISFLEHDALQEKNMDTVEHLKTWFRDKVPKDNKKEMKNMLQNHLPELFWKASITVNLTIRDETLELSDWLQEYRRQHPLPYEEDDIDSCEEWSEYTYDSHGCHRIVHCWSSGPSTMCETPLIFESDTTVITSRMNGLSDGLQLSDITITFLNVDIPVEFVI